jgi:hypothetical protein
MSLTSRLAIALVVLPLLTTAAAFAGSDVSVADFKSIQLRGGGHVVIQHGATQRVTLVKGSTEFTKLEVVDGNTLRIDACNSNCPQHYDLEIDIVSPAIDGVAIKGGGHIESKGDFPKQDRIGAAVQGGGNIDIRGMSVDNVEAAVDGGGEIMTKPERSLQAAINGGGSITYSGNPRVTSAINGGGSVTKN